jgi:hypothetical protein
MDLRASETIALRAGDLRDGHQTLSRFERQFENRPDSTGIKQPTLERKTGAQALSRVDA